MASQIMDTLEVEDLFPGGAVSAWYQDGASPIPLSDKARIKDVGLPAVKKPRRQAFPRGGLSVIAVSSWAQAQPIDVSGCEPTRFVPYPKMSLTTAGDYRQGRLP